MIDITSDKIDEETTNTNKVQIFCYVQEKSVCSINSNVNYCQIDDNLSENDDKLNNGWKQRHPICPKQNNYYDCGVFVCKFMDYITREQKMNFTQVDMEYFRTLIGIELINGNVLTI